MPDTFAVFAGERVLRLCVIEADALEYRQAFPVLFHAREDLIEGRATRKTCKMTGQEPNDESTDIPVIRILRVVREIPADFRAKGQPVLSPCVFVSYSCRFGVRRLSEIFPRTIKGVHSGIYSLHQVVVHRNRQCRARHSRSVQPHHRFGIVRNREGCADLEREGLVGLLRRHDGQLLTLEWPCGRSTRGTSCRTHHLSIAAMVIIAIISIIIVIISRTIVTVTVTVTVTVVVTIWNVVVERVFILFVGVVIGFQVFFFGVSSTRGSEPFNKSDGVGKVMFIFTRLNEKGIVFPPSVIWILVAITDLIWVSSHLHSRLI